MAFYLYWIFFFLYLIVEEIIRKVALSVINSKHITELYCPRKITASFLGLYVTSTFSKIQTKEPPKLLSSSGMDRGKFIFFN